MPLLSRATRCRLALAALLAVSLLAPAALALPSRAEPGDRRYAAFVQDAGTGEVLFAVDADAPRYPASLTKMMTLYLAFEALGRGKMTESTRIRVSRHAASRPPSKLGLRAGSTISVGEAMMALVTKSANDAAAALGEHLGGSEAGFARMMTRKARALGMGRTTFRNASGLPDRGQVTTARDIAVLSRRLIRDFPERYAYFSASGFDWRGRYIGNHNRLLTAYDGADGIKTGYIDASGFNLAASAVRDGRRLVAVVFGGASGAARDAHVMALLDQGFDQIAPPQGGTMMASRGGLRFVGTAQAAAIAPALRPLPRVAAPRPVVRAAVPRPRPPAARKAPVPGRWAVQVGAYADRGPAQAAARRAAAGGGTVDLRRVRVRSGWLWRARVTGLSQDRARRACRTARGPCIAVAPGQ
ncbi:D-alanyl-D-alanine carboxypeptidase family protein [Pararoseomonas indoligenes]|uniref:D-alanyl-D-alanine carboxypeptidase n=1 Tax=Roseomonas indoligenes TaxID=2820811 RepID=A0A940MYS6_9PROT|nr:D-alanyl-D-alanine carboxypeptidase family protein [Pararoseomonas indoligenes]MBP0495844.1 D-alanyl-D-alanine carboxypeptidase [Pararoseomonas indoligenes]